MTPAWSQHFDTCLGCMACETACPSGVRYAPLIEETRAAIEHHHTASARRTAVPPTAVLAAAVPAPAAAVRAAAALVDALRERQAVLSLLPRKLRNLIALAPDARLGAVARDVAGAHAAVGATGVCASGS